MSIEFKPEPLGLDARAKEALEDGRRWFPGVGSSLAHNVLALCGEAGELANLVKKIDRGGPFDKEMLVKLVGETVDVQTYLYEIMGLLDEISRRDFATELYWEGEYDKKRGFNENRFGFAKVFENAQNDISDRWYPRD